MRRFENTEDGSAKFWEVEVRGAVLRVRFGKLGSEGRPSEKTLASAAAAEAEAAKLIQEKTKKGYVEIGAEAATEVAAKAGPSKAKGAAKTPAAKTPAAKTPPAKTAAAKAAPAEPSEAPARHMSPAQQAVWKNPLDRDALRVWADELSAAGDPRGELMQLRLIDDPSEAQSAKAAALEKKVGGKVAGAARPFLDYWHLDRAGMVSMVYCDGHKLFDGWTEILALHPRLTVCWTTLRKQTMATAQKVAQLPLAKLYFLRIESGLTDRALAVLGPALAGIKHLSIASTDVTPEGLAAVAPHLASLEFLCLAPPVSRLNDTAMCNAFAALLAGTPAFHKLRAVHFFRHGFPDAKHKKLLEGMPAMKQVVDSFSPPIDGDVIEGWMRGES